MMPSCAKRHYGRKIAMTNNLLILGCGYSGLALARAFDGHVYGTTRTRQVELKAAHITPLHLDDESEIKTNIQNAQAIVISMPPPDAALAYAEKINASKAWVGYLSTTSVYGDFAGGWVDETTPPAPQSERGKARLETEQSWQENVPRINIFRLAGIYGVGRGPLEKLRSGRVQKVIKDGQVFGRIHVDDIARIVLASVKAGDEGEIYNLTDDLPAPPEDVLDYAAKILGSEPLEPVPFEEAKLSPMARSFYGESKRVNNQKIRNKFGPLLYPDYVSGLDAILREEQARKE